MRKLNRPNVLSSQFLSVGHETRRWFLALTLSDFLEARSAAVEANDWHRTGESQLSTKAFERAALAYSRPFRACLTPSGRTVLTLPRGLPEALGGRSAAVHARVMARREHVAGHRDMTDGRLLFCVSSDHEGLDFAAVLTRPAPQLTDIQALIEIIDRLAGEVKTELAIMVTGDRWSAPLFGMEMTLKPSDDD
jgi:hypothetical protein